MGMQDYEVPFGLIGEDGVETVDPAHLLGWLRERGYDATAARVNAERQQVVIEADHDPVTALADYAAPGWRRSLPNRYQGMVEDAEWGARTPLDARRLVRTQARMTPL